MRDQDFAPHCGCDNGRSKWDDEDECYSDDEDEDDEVYDLDMRCTDYGEAMDFFN